MPGGPIPEQDNRHLWESQQELLQEQGRDFSIHKRRLHRQVLASEQVQSAIEMDAVSTGA